MLADRLAARVGMPARQRSRSSSRPASHKRAPRNGPELTVRQRGRMSVGRGNLLTQAITLVLHHPAAAGAIEDPGSARAASINPVLPCSRSCCSRPRRPPRPSTAMLLERWRDRPEYERLGDAGHAETPWWPIPRRRLRNCKMAVEKLLEEYGPGRRMDELLRKAEELGLNYDEKAELSCLLKSKGRSRSALLIRKQNWLRNGQNRILLGLHFKMSRSLTRRPP